jgi:hypothetical protein
MADPSPTPAATSEDVPLRPSQVSTAVILLCLSLVLGQVTSVLLRPNLPHGPEALFVQVATFALLAWLTYKIWVGRNWARITFTVLFAVGLLFYVPILVRFFQFSSVAGSINLVQSLLQLVALYLLFTDPGRGWFKARSPVA